MRLLCPRLLALGMVAASASGCSEEVQALAPPVVHGQAPATPRIIAPANAEFTGSVRAKGLDPMRPVFAWREISFAKPVSYDLELDDSCIAGAVQRCRFLSPEVRITGIAGTTWQPEKALSVNAQQPLGKRYFWRLRACAGSACSPWTNVRYLEVGRTRGDLNGDGYSDIAVGAPLIDNGGKDRGSVFVYLGGPGGLTHDSKVSERLDDPYAQDESSFGVSVAMAGDVNADGFADLVVGAAGSDDAAGYAYIYLGAAGGLDERPYRLRPQRSAYDDWFGAAVAGAGDVDGDGFADVLVGASGTDGTNRGRGTDLGVTHVFHGSPTGVTLRASVNLGIGQLNYDQFGFAVTSAGDLNGDGYADVAIGSPGSDRAGNRAGTDRGAVYVYLGSAEGLLSTPSQRLVSSSPRDHDLFGFSVSGAGDIDGDGFGDLLVGAPGKDDFTDDGGIALVYNGTASGIDSKPSRVLTDPSASPHQRFGTSVAAAGDINSDGRADILVGASSKSRGRALLYEGNREGIPEQPSSAVVDPLGDGFNHFAEGVAGAGDVNGDGFDDIIVGASGADNGGIYRGSVVLYPGTEAGLDDTRKLRIDDPEHGIHDHFGHVVAGR